MNPRKQKLKETINNKENSLANGESQEQDVQEIHIERLASDGSGVGYLDGKATFVPGLLPGEKGFIKIKEEKKTYQRAELLDVVNPSPERQIPLCSVYKECGGCNLQHLKYESTLEWKRQWVEDALKRIGKLSNIQVEPVLGMSDPWRYRNKAVLHRDKQGFLGYYRPGTNDVIPFEDCLLLSEKTNSRIKQLKEGFQSVTFRENSRGEGLVFPEENPTEVLDPRGQYFYEYLDDLRFRVSPKAFLQVNHAQTVKLYSLILNYAELQGQEEVWDLYCGIGTITLMLAKRARKVIGIEENSQAVEDAVINAQENGITNVSFIQGKVEDKLINLTGNPDIVVIDPPRAGMDHLVIDRMLKIKPQRIIYVSCNPATLARDLKVLTGSGMNGLDSSKIKSSEKYVIEKVQPVDMFPWSHHTETVVLMSRVDER